MASVFNNVCKQGGERQALLALDHNRATVHVRGTTKAISTFLPLLQAQLADVELLSLGVGAQPAHPQCWAHPDWHKQGVVCEQQIVFTLLPCMFNFNVCPGGNGPRTFASHILELGGVIGMCTADFGTSQSSHRRGLVAGLA